MSLRLSRHLVTDTKYTHIIRWSLSQFSSAGSPYRDMKGLDTILQGKIKGKTALHTSGFAVSFTPKLLAPFRTLPKLFILPYFDYLPPLKELRSSSHV